jgi:DNA-binding FadR family transcriptional regulator
LRAWLVEKSVRPRATWSAGDGGRFDGARPAPAGKLAEVVAQQIRADIIRSGWDVGRVFGSEPELLARYGVSRAVLREAVRLLEHHSVARMRRGPGGGLVVTEPDPTASIEAMALYLDYQRLSPDDLRAVRNAIELGCIDLLMERAPDPDVVAALDSSLRVSDTTPLEQLNELSHAMHTRIADVSGNPTLAVFLRVLTNLWARHNAMPDNPPIAGAEVPAAVSRAHRGIVDAIASGDHGLARHRMLRHLEALTDWWH